MKENAMAETKREPIIKPDPEGMNDERVQLADLAIQAFQQKCFRLPEDPDTVVSDLLCDMHHWCDSQGLDFEEMLYRASQHYAAETAMTIYENKYHCVPCNHSWTVENCDSMHNDRCPACDAECEPYDSDVISDNTA
jgi:hypothetical protein